MKVWEVEELSDYPGLVLAVATIKTPASWRILKSKAWLCHAGEAMRAMFPNLPEKIEGPWGILERDAVFGADEASSAILHALEGLCLREGVKISQNFCESGFETGSVPLYELESEGKIELIDTTIDKISATSQAARISFKPPRSSMTLDRKIAFLYKIDSLFDNISQEMKNWIPTIIELSDPSKLTRDEIEKAVALANKAQLDRETSAISVERGIKTRI